MDQLHLDFLRSSRGRHWFDQLQGFEGDFYRRLKWLRRSLAAGEAASLLELDRARQSLSHRHTGWASLFLDCAAAAQASSQVVAEWRAARFKPGEIVADLCCGAGIDTLALAKNSRVLAVDSSSRRLDFAQANAIEFERSIQLIRGRAPDCLGKVDLAFCDPDRRRGDKRIYDPFATSPGLGELLASTLADGMGVKMSPMAPLDGLDDLGELEFISVGRELKEIVLWTGSLNRGSRGVSLPAKSFHLQGQAGLLPELATELGSYLLDPDPALVRSGLLGDVARRHGLMGLAPDIAYLTSNDDPHSLLLAARPILGISRTGQKPLQTLVNTHDIGRLDISRRGYPQSPEEVRKRLRLKGSRPGHLHLTRFGDQRVGILTMPARGQG